MTNKIRDIGTEDLKIEELVKLLREDKYLIPTFQREFVWQPYNIKKLWDSMLKFYPMGSLLYWETDSYLHTHRKLGGFKFPHDEDTIKKFKEWKYILDGQQRATSILVCMLGGKGRVEGDDNFDFTLFFDATMGDFFFANEFENRKKNVLDDRFLVRIRDVPKWDFNFYKTIGGIEGFNAEIENNMQEIQRMFTDYKISVIRIRGVEVNEVCEIFERINQEGKKLDQVDIIVAKTYRNPKPEINDPGFYLRDNLNRLINRLAESKSRWKDIYYLLIIQMAAICLRKEYTDTRNPFGITPAALNNLQTNHLQDNWNKFEKTIFETIKFFTDQKIYGPDMLPFVYLMLPICHYFHNNNSPNRDLTRQWFWRNAFGLEYFSNSSDVYNYCQEFFSKLEQGFVVEIPELVISKTRIVQTNYYYRNALSRAVLAWLANHKPIDFSDPYADVLDNVYLLLNQAPNLHHIYPQNFLNGIEELPQDISPDSLMNICFLRARTNIQISDKNPLVYFREYMNKVSNFDSILESHLIDIEYINKEDFVPQDYKEFLFSRAESFCETLKRALPNVNVKIVQ